jgi:hypothetical protein
MRQARIRIITGEDGNPRMTPALVYGKMRAMASLAGFPTSPDAVRALRAGGLLSWSKEIRFALCVASILLSLNLYAPAQPSTLVRLLASAIILTSAFAIWLWKRGYDHYTAFFPLITLFYAVNFGVPVFVLMAYIFVLGGKVVSEVYVEQALALALAGLLCMLSGYYLVTLTTLREHLPKFEMQWRPQGGLELWAYPLTFIGLVLFVFTQTNRGESSIFVLASEASKLFILGILILFFLQLIGRLSWMGKFYLWGILLPLRTLLALGTGSLGPAQPPIYAMLFAYTLVRRKIPWLILVLGVFVLGALHSYKNSFRTLTWHSGPAANRSLMQKAGLFLELGEIFWQTPPPLELVVTAVCLRLSHVIELANVMRETPANVPYWNGETYYPLLTKWIPRALWQDKPKETVPQAYGHRYNFIAPENDETQYAITHLTEFYVNFGIGGAVVGMFLMGLIYGCLQACFIHRRSGIGAVIVAVYLLSGWFTTETNLSELLGSLLHQALLIATLNLVMRMRWEVLPEGAPLQAA